MSENVTSFSGPEVSYENTIDGLAQGHSSASPAYQIPAEIWAVIFTYATWIPGVFETNDSDALAIYASDRFGIRLEEMHWQSMQTKLAINEVCLAFNSISTQHLFEYIVIVEGDQLLDLVDVLEQSDAASNDRAFGRWTLRMDLRLQGMHVWEDRHFRGLRRALACMPNLQIFSMVFCTVERNPYLYESDEFAEALQHLRHCTKLKRLELVGDVPLLNAFLPDVAPGLEVLWIVSSSDRVIDEPVPIDFPKLHTLVTSWTSRHNVLDKWQIPNLAVLISDHPRSIQNASVLFRRIRYESMYGSIADEDNDLLTNKGDQCMPSPSMYWNFHDLCCRRQLPAPYFPGLSSLTISHYRRFSGFIWSDGFCNNGGDKVFAHFTAGLTDMFEVVDKSIFPDLQLLRLVVPERASKHSSRPKVQASEELRRVWRTWIDQCKPRDIRVEACVGVDEWERGLWRAFTPEMLFL